MSHTETPHWQRLLRDGLSATFSALAAIVGFWLLVHGVHAGYGPFEWLLSLLVTGTLAFYWFWSRHADTVVIALGVLGCLTRLLFVTYDDHGVIYGTSVCVILVGVFMVLRRTDP